MNGYEILYIISLRVKKKIHTREIILRRQVNKRRKYDNFVCSYNEFVYWRVITFDIRAIQYCVQWILKIQRYLHIGSYLPKPTRTKIKLFYSCYFMNFSRFHQLEKNLEDHNT